MTKIWELRWNEHTKNLGKIKSKSGSNAFVQFMCYETDQVVDELNSMYGVVKNNLDELICVHIHCS